MADDALKQALATQARIDAVTPAICRARVAAGADESDPEMAQISHELPTFGVHPTSPYTTFYNPKTFQNAYGGQKIIGIIGGGQFGWRSYDGWLVAFWQKSDNTFFPLAGFQIAGHFGMVRSVAVKD